MGLVKVWCKFGMGLNVSAADGHQTHMITKESGRPTNAGHQIHMITKESDRSGAAGHHKHVNE